MNDQLFQTLLTSLQPNTLARLVIDLESLREDWAAFPEDAPPADTRQALITALTLVREIGQTLTEQEGLNFQQLITQASAERDEAEWAAERDRQERDNWLSDFD